MKRADDLSLADFLRKSVAQPYGSVQHQAVQRRIFVADEIALPLELHGLARIGLGNRRLDPGVFQDLQRQRIKVGGEIGGIRARLGKELVVDADFGRPGLCHRQPVHGRLDLAPVGALPPFVAGS